MLSIIPDTNCLILLSKIGACQLLPLMYDKVLVPEIVLKEFKEIFPIPHQIINCQNTPLLKKLETQLDSGEAAVICAGLETKESIVAIDDLKGRKIASSLGLRVTGTLGILVKAKRNGHITVLEPLVEKLIQVGIRISPTIIEEIRKDYPWAILIWSK